MSEGRTDATVQVEYLDHSGQSVGFSTHMLPPMGAVREDPSTKVPLSFQGSAVVMADQPVAVRVDEYWTLPCDPPTNALITVAPSDSAEAGTIMTFTVTAEGTPPLDYTWDFDDGSEATGSVALHSSATPDDYSVTVTVANLCGSTSASQSVQVTPVYSNYIYLPLVIR